MFYKKVRYESRKRMADTRPRVRGQFVKRGAGDVSFSKQEADDDTARLPHAEGSSGEEGGSSPKPLFQKSVSDGNVVTTLQAGEYAAVLPKPAGNSVCVKKTIRKAEYADDSDDDVIERPSQRRRRAAPVQPAPVVAAVTAAATAAATASAAKEDEEVEEAHEVGASGNSSNDEFPCATQTGKDDCGATASDDEHVSISLIP